MIAWRCPDCGEQILNDDWYTPFPGRWGHYHDPPKDWPHDEDPWFNAEQIEVVPVSEALVTAIYEWRVAWPNGGRGTTHADSHIALAVLRDVAGFYRDDEPPPWLERRQVGEWERVDD